MKSSCELECGWLEKSECHLISPRGHLEGTELSYLSFIFQDILRRRVGWLSKCLKTILLAVKLDAKFVVNDVGTAMLMGLGLQPVSILSPMSLS